MASRTRVRLLAALEGARELDTSAESSPQSSPQSSHQSSPDSVSSKSSFMRRKLDAAFDKECDLLEEITSKKIEKQITKLKVQALLQLDDDDTIFQRIMENHKKGLEATAKLMV